MQLVYRLFVLNRLELRSRKNITSRVVMFDKSIRGEKLIRFQFDINGRL